MSYNQTINPNLDDNTLTAPWDGAAARDWLGSCLMVARSVFRIPADKYTAWEEWEATENRHTDRNLPSGVAVLLWFEHWGTYYDARIKSNRYGNWGHVLVYKDGVFYSSPISHKAYFDRFDSIEQVEQKYRATFVGWSESLGSARVAQYVPDAPPAPVYTVEAITPKQIMVFPGHNKWNLSLPDFNTIAANPVSTSPDGPITVVAVLKHGAMPQYAYYLEDASVPQGYNTLDCNDYTPPPPPTPDSQPETPPAAPEQPTVPTPDEPTPPLPGTVVEPDKPTVPTPKPPKVIVPDPSEYYKAQQLVAALLQKLFGKRLSGLWGLLPDSVQRMVHTFWQTFLSFFLAGITGILSTVLQTHRFSDAASALAALIVAAGAAAWSGAKAKYKANKAQ